MNASGKRVLAVRKRGLTIRALDGEVLVYDPETTRATCLNDVAAEVLARCDGTHRPADIARDLPFEGVDERIVSLALADLQKAELLEAGSAADAIAPTGPSRRELIRRLGVGTAVALPVVTTILLPHPAAAISAGSPCFTGEGGIPDPCFAINLVCIRAGEHQGGNCEKPGNDCTCQQPG